MSAPIRSKPSTKEYRENWERIFAKDDTWSVPAGTKLRRKIFLSRFERLQGFLQMHVNDVGPPDSLCVQFSVPQWVTSELPGDGLR